MVLAARGARESESGIIAVDDPAVEAALRAQARGVVLRATVLAIAGTAVGWWLPW